MISTKKVLFLLCLCLPGYALAYSYTILPPITGKGTLAISPTLFADNINSGGMELFLYYGLTDKTDISTSVLTYNGSSAFSVMLRYDFGGSKIIALRGNTSWVAPQFLFSVENDRLFLQTTAAVQFTYDYMEHPAAYVLLCPGVKLPKGFDLYCEVNPGYYSYEGDFANLWVRQKGFGLDVVPGIGFTVGNALFSIGVPLYDVTNNIAPTVGAWVYYAIAPK